MIKARAIRVESESGDYFVIKVKKWLLGKWDYVRVDFFTTNCQEAWNKILKFKTFEECEKYIKDNILRKSVKGYRETVLKEYDIKDITFNGFY